jgi:hypothetical protein
VAEVRAIGRAQADREVALEAHVDRRLGLGKALRQSVREGNERPLDHQRAGLAARLVLERLVHPVAVIPAADHPHVLTAGVRGLRDEHELRVERHRDVTDQLAKEGIPDRTRGSLRNRAKQVPAGESRTGPVGVDVERHDPLPGIDATAPCPTRRPAAADMFDGRGGPASRVTRPRPTTTVSSSR